MTRAVLQPAAPPTRAIRALLGYLAAAVLLAVLGAATTISGAGVAQQSGPQVPWQPPLAAVVAIWTVLFVAQAVAAWLVHRRRRSGIGPSLWLHWSFVLLQAVWLLLFSLGVDVWIVLGVIVLVDVVGAATAFAFWQTSRLAGALLTASVVWLVLGTASSVVGNALRGV